MTEGLYENIWVDGGGGGSSKISNYNKREVGSKYRDEKTLDISHFLYFKI